MSTELDIEVRARNGKVYVTFTGPDVTVEYPMGRAEAREVGEAIIQAADAA